jgi:hypothetical protein
MKNWFNKILSRFSLFKSYWYISLTWKPKISSYTIWHTNIRQRFWLIHDCIPQKVWVWPNYQSISWSASTCIASNVWDSSFPQCEIYVEQNRDSLWWKCNWNGLKWRSEYWTSPVFKWSILEKFWHWNSGPFEYRPCEPDYFKSQMAFRPLSKHSRNWIVWPL